MVDYSKYNMENIKTQIQYNLIPDGSALFVVQSGKEWDESGATYRVIKNGNRLESVDEEFSWWDWNERDLYGFDIEVYKAGTPKEEDTEAAAADKHLKGYLFDSLVFRYQLALERGVGARTLEFLDTKKGVTKAEAENRARWKNNDDLMRFIRVLEEAIGERD